MRIITAVCSLLLVAQGRMDEDEDDDEWIDPYDMLNYDASTKTMRKTSELSNYPDVPTKRKEYVEHKDQAESIKFKTKLELLQTEKIDDFSQQQSCNPVFKRFLIKLLKEIEKVDMPSDFQNDIYYNAIVKLSQQALTEIQKFVEGTDSWRTGALDDALSQILVELKPHNYEPWRWRFEDTFGVDINTVIKVAVCALVIVGIICTELWSKVSWFVQFKRIFAICFLISLVWNWFFLYEIAFAEHQSKMVKMEGVDAKCTGRKKIDWWDNLKDWGRVTFTLQDDPCKMYYEVLMVNPILLVPPTKAVTMTITNFFTEPLKHIGQGISEFLRALLKDLPVTLQIPVLILIVLVILVFMYGGAQAAIQHGINRIPRIGGPRDPPPPGVEQAHPIHRGIDHDRFAEGDAPQHPDPMLRYRPGLPVNQGLQDQTRNYIHPLRVNVETLRNADQLLINDHIDSARRESQEGGSDAEDRNLSAGADNTDVQICEDQVLTEETKDSVLQEAINSSAHAKANEKDMICDSTVKADGQSGPKAVRQALPAKQDNNMPEKSLGTIDPSFSGQQVEDVGVSVQENEPVSLAL